jgi:hypothetical protein
MLECQICNKILESNRALFLHQNVNHNPLFRERMKIAISLSNKKRGGLKGVENPMWKENAGYVSIHRYIAKRKPKPDKCEDCNLNKILELSFNNHPNSYTRNPEDYSWLCRKCHMTHDGRIYVGKYERTPEIREKMRIIGNMVVSVG